MSEIHIITGGAGFLGSTLCRALLDRGHEVICIDSLVTGGIDRIEDLLPRQHFKFVRGDAATALRPLNVGRVHAVWALAALASPVHYFKRPLEAAWAGADAHRATLDFAADHAARFFYSSTSELYSNPDVVPTPETYIGRINPLSLRAPYDVSKAYGETLCAIYARTVGLDVRIARLFNAFGPNMPVSDGRVICSYLGAAIKGEPLPVHGDGKQTRSFCYVEDTIRGMLAFMGAPREALIPAGEPPIINLGNPREVTMLGVARLCWRAVRDDEPQIAQLPENPDDPRRRCPDITRAREILKWEPKIELEDGLRRTAVWLKQGR